MKSAATAGIKLAEECKIDADIVVPVPETACRLLQAIGKQSGIPWKWLF